MARQPRPDEHLGLGPRYSAQKPLFPVVFFRSTLYRYREKSAVSYFCSVVSKQRDRRTREEPRGSLDLFLRCLCPALRVDSHELCCYKTVAKSRGRELQQKQCVFHSGILSAHDNRKSRFAACSTAYLRVLVLAATLVVLLHFLPLLSLAFPDAG